MEFLRQNTAATIIIGLVDWADGKTLPIDNDTFDPSKLQCVIYKNGTGSALSIAKTGDNAINLSSLNDGMATLTLTVGNTDTAGRLKIIISNLVTDGLESEYMLRSVADFEVLSEDSYDMLFVGDLPEPTGLFSRIGVNLVSNPGFDTDTVWTKGQYWSISDGKAVFAAAGGTIMGLSQNIGVVAGKSYRVIVTVSDYSIADGFLFVYLGADVQYPNTTYKIEGDGRYVFIITADSDGSIRFKTSGTGNGDTFKLDDVTAEEVFIGLWQKLNLLWRRFFKKATCSDTELKLFKDGGQVVNTTQAVSDFGIIETVGDAE
jgi:hypothetical protein